MKGSEPLTHPFGAPSPHRRGTAMGKPLCHRLLLSVFKKNAEEKVREAGMRGSEPRWKAPVPANESNT